MHAMHPRPAAQVCPAAVQSVTVGDPPSAAHTVRTLPEQLIAVSEPAEQGAPAPESEAAEASGLSVLDDPQAASTNALQRMQTVQMETVRVATPRIQEERILLLYYECDVSRTSASSNPSREIDSLPPALSPCPSSWQVRGRVGRTLAPGRRTPAPRGEASSTRQANNRKYRRQPRTRRPTVHPSRPVPRARRLRASRSSAWEGRTRARASSMARRAAGEAISPASSAPAS